MATDAFVILEQLRCISLRNTEQETEPYIWPVLIRVDDNTLSTPELVDIVTPVQGNARIVIKDNMRARETAAIPSSVGILRTRFEDGLTVRRLILVVALLEMDETPKPAMRAGFRTFGSELRAAIAENLIALDQAEGEAEKQLIKSIQERVEDRVTSAIKDGLTSWEKTKVFAGVLNMDDPSGSAFLTFGKEGLIPTPITLAFEASRRLPFPPVVSSSQYEIRGQLQIRPVVIKRCQAQIDRVNAAQSVVNGIEEQIKDLQAQLQGEGDEPPLPKDFINDEIERLRDEELGPAMDALKAARIALEICRARIVADTQGGGVATAYHPNNGACPARRLL